MDDRIQEHLDGIMKTAIPLTVFAEEQRHTFSYAQKRGREADGENKLHLAEAYSALSQQSEQVAGTIAKIAEETPITIEGILNGNIPPVLDYLSRRNKRLVADLTYTIELAAIAAYLNQNGEAVHELIPILLPEADIAGSNQTDWEKRDELKFELKNVMQEAGWDEKIQEWLRSTTDASEESPPMPPGHSRKE